MKKLFILLALSSFTFGSAVAATVSAVNETVIADPCGDDGKCKKGKKCCKAKAPADANTSNTSEIKVDAPKPADKAPGCEKSADKPSCCSKKASAEKTEVKPAAPEKK